MSKDKLWNKEFTPFFTPEEMLRKGVFEGKYINNIKGIPNDWKKLPKVVGPKDEPDPSLNFYGVKSRQPLSEWKKNGWIRTDKNGWFEWYCRYFLGRRLGEEDDWQIGRWKSFIARHQAQVSKKCKPGDKDCNTKQRQGLLQWGWDSDLEFNDVNKKKALDRLIKLPNVSIEEIGIIIPPSANW